MKYCVDCGYCHHNIEKDEYRCGHSSAKSIVDRKPQLCEYIRNDFSLCGYDGNWWIFKLQRDSTKSEE